MQSSHASCSDSEAARDHCDRRTASPTPTALSTDEMLASMAALRSAAARARPPRPSRGVFARAHEMTNSRSFFFPQMTDGE